MLQVCRYLETYPENFDYDYEFPSPCYAIQVRAETSDGYKYHYVVSGAPQTQWPDSWAKAQRSVIFSQKSDLLDGKILYILASEFDRNIPRIPTAIESVRFDIFDDQFHYLGSTIPALSKELVPQFMRLPDALLKQLLLWGYFRFDDFKGIMVGESAYSFTYPECGDMVIEKRREANRSNIEAK
jgi:hypothetical protein